MDATAYLPGILHYYNTLPSQAKSGGRHSERAKAERSDPESDAMRKKFFDMLETRS